MNKLVMFLTVLSAVAHGIFWICLAWIGIEAIAYVGEHGLKELLTMLWEGKP